MFPQAKKSFSYWTMSLSLIIDGYNLIRQSPEMREHDRKDLDKGRQLLLKKLASYRRTRNHEVTVVFDGWLHGYFSEQAEKVAGINVCFSRRGEQADEVIKHLALKHRDKAIVVTSDSDLGYACSRAGCEVITSQQFEERLAMAEYLGGRGMMGEEKEDDGPLAKGTRKKGPSKRLPKVQRKREQVLKKL